VKVLKFVSIIVLVVVVAVVGYGGYVYWRINSGTQRDLGVRYTADDYTRAVTDKAGVGITDPDQLYLGADFQISGSHDVDQTFTEAEISAILNTLNQANGPLKNVQVRLLGKGRGEISAQLDFHKYGLSLDGPFYATGGASSTGSRSASFRADQVVVGDYTVPGWIRDRVGNEVTAWVNDELGKVEGLDIQSAEIGNGAAQFRGSLPTSITGLGDQ